MVLTTLLTLAAAALGVDADFDGGDSDFDSGAICLVWHQMLPPVGNGWRCV